MKIIDGKEVSIYIKEKIRAEVELMSKTGRRPGLAVILVGDDPASHVYVNNKKKACEFCGFYSESYELSADTTEAELIELIERL